MRRTYVAATWALLRRRFPHVLFVACANLIIDFLRIYPQVPDGTDILGWVFPEFITTEMFFATTVVAALTLAQVAPVEGWRRIPLMLVAGFGSVALWVGFAWLAFVHLDWGFVVRENIVTSFASHAMTVAWAWCAVVVALTFFYLTQEREALLAQRARVAELERVEAQRTVLASRLDVMRARVEPEFLFGALAEVRKFYQRDRAVADEMLDALIAYLRAALPQMRGQASTLRREVDLAVAYAAVLQVPRGDSLSVGQRVDDGMDDVSLAPLVLLPLTQAAFEGGEASLRTRYAIDAAATGGGILVTLTIDGGSRPAAWSDGGSDAARRTLEAYYADSARLEFGGDGTRHWARVSLAATAFSTAPIKVPSPTGSEQSAAVTASGVRA